MKIILLGVGSIGLRHLNNLRFLRPEAQVVMADPKFLTDRMTLVYDDWRVVLREHWDADGVIIASPTQHHAEQLHDALGRGMPAYVEKPLMGVSEWRPAMREDLLKYDAYSKVALGYQYRFCVTGDMYVKVHNAERMEFYARDNLIERYGPTVMETMGSHAIDLALSMLGRASGGRLYTDGRRFKGYIQHEHGPSFYDMRIDEGPRISTMNGEALNIDNETYIRALLAWLNWIETGRRPGRLATMSDGVAVMDVMAQCRMLE